MSEALIYIEKNGQRVAITDVSAINPSPELIRNIERALDGSLCVDIVAEKEKYDLVWELVVDSRYRKILEGFSLQSILKIDFSKINLDFKEDEEGESANYKYKEYIVESINGTPVFYGSKLYWQNVSIKVMQM